MGERVVRTLPLANWALSYSKPSGIDTLTCIGSPVIGFLIGSTLKSTMPSNAMVAVREALSASIEIRALSATTLPEWTLLLRAHRIVGDPERHVVVLHAVGIAEERIVLPPAGLRVEGEEHGVERLLLRPRQLDVGGKLRLGDPDVRPLVRTMRSASSSSVRMAAIWVTALTS